MTIPEAIHDLRRLSLNDGIALATPVADPAARRTTVSFLEFLPPPVLALVWVLFNAGLAWFGESTGHPNPYLVAAGAVDGAILSIIMVNTIGEKFQAGATGLLGGFGLGNLGSADGTSPLSAVASAIHRFVDTISAFEGSEDLHKDFESATVNAIWVAVFVILAALLVQWAQKTASKSHGATSL